MRVALFLLLWGVQPVFANVYLACMELAASFDSASCRTVNDRLQCMDGVYDCLEIPGHSCDNAQMYRCPTLDFYFNNSLSSCEKYGREYLCSEDGSKECPTGYRLMDGHCIKEKVVCPDGYEVGSYMDGGERVNVCVEKPSDGSGSGGGGSSSGGNSSGGNGSGSSGGGNGSDGGSSNGGSSGGSCVGTDYDGLDGYDCSKSHTPDGGGTPQPCMTKDFEKLSNYYDCSDASSACSAFISADKTCNLEGYSCSCEKNDAGSGLIVYASKGNGTRWKHPGAPGYQCLFEGDVCSNEQRIVSITDGGCSSIDPDGGCDDVPYSGGGSGSGGNSGGSNSGGDTRTNDEEEDCLLKGYTWVGVPDGIGACHDLGSDGGSGCPSGFEDLGNGCGRAHSSEGGDALGDIQDALAGLPGEIGDEFRKVLKDLIGEAPTSTLDVDKLEKFDFLSDPRFIAAREDLYTTFRTIRSDIGGFFVASPVIEGDDCLFTEPVYVSSLNQSLDFSFCLSDYKKFFEVLSSVIIFMSFIVAFTIIFKRGG